jgi:hypothetical protein
LKHSLKLNWFTDGQKVFVSNEINTLIELEWDTKKSPASRNKQGV